MARLDVKGSKSGEVAAKNQLLTNEDEVRCGGVAVLRYPGEAE